MYTHTQLATEVGITCQMEEFDLDILKARLDTMAPPIECQQDEGTLPRIPLFQRTGPINEVLTEEASDILNRYKELCKLYVTAYQEDARYSTVERVKACSLLEPYISGVLQQVDATLAILCIENELRRLKDMEQFKIPVLTPHARTIESNIQLQAYCQPVDNEVKAIFKETYKFEGPGS